MKIIKYELVSLTALSLPYYEWSFRLKYTMHVVSYTFKTLWPNVNFTAFSIYISLQKAFEAWYAKIKIQTKPNRVSVSTSWYVLVVGWIFISS